MGILLTTDRLSYINDTHQILLGNGRHYDGKEVAIAMGQSYV